MAGAAPEGSQFDACQYDAKMNELLTADGQDFFASYDEVYDSFDAMGLQENLLRGIYAYGFEKPSAIQQRGIVPFCKGLDVIQQAQSGTGKRATFCSGTALLMSSPFESEEMSSNAIPPNAIEVSQQAPTGSSQHVDEQPIEEQAQGNTGGEVALFNRRKMQKTSSIWEHFD